MKNNSRLESLDSARGLAVLGVLPVHCGQFFQTGIDIIQKITTAGAYGLQFFFLVSAFTMGLHVGHVLFLKMHQ